MAGELLWICIGRLILWKERKEEREKAEIVKKRERKDDNFKKSLLSLRTKERQDVV